MIINIQDDILILHNRGILKRLLEDKTTKKNIMWATDAYNDYGGQYYRNEEIKPELITGRNSDIIKTRARKELEQQFERTRRKAEVFTPQWICKRMNDDAERFLFDDIVTVEEVDNDTDYLELVLRDAKLFKKYIDSKRLEITCGEAPYLVSRYDVATGEMIPVSRRIGILDRKLQAIDKYAKNEEEWIKWVIRAYQATFGYEFQGDNVLIARVNLLMSLAEYMEERWSRKPTDKEYEKIANVVSWNIWQMDGLTYTIPYSKAEERTVQLDIFGFLQEDDESNPQEEEIENKQPYCRIFDWHNKKKSFEFHELKKGMHMKFDFIIGNPPYQEGYQGESSGANSIYDKFMSETFGISDRVELITPARFLFNAGSTPKAWNEKMLQDPHFKVLFYESDAAKVFPNVTITGGVAITYRDKTACFGPVEVFTAFPELNTILKKVKKHVSFNPISEMVVTSFAYHFTDKMHDDYPEAKSLMSKGHAYDLKSSSFERLPQVFLEDKPSDEYAQILGRYNNERTYRYIKRSYINDVSNFDKYKLFYSKADGAAGTIGKPIPARIIGQAVIGTPGMGSTESFLSVGNFDSIEEVKNLEKYIKGKFARAMLSVLKVTQDITPSKWKYVPNQDFTQSSDIDWLQPISDIDRQLYAKYGLDQNEIDFIESHVKEMK